MEKNPKDHEKKIVRQLYRYDSRLFGFFVASVISDGGLIQSLN